MSKNINPLILKNLEVEAEQKNSINVPDAIAIDFGEKFCGMAWSQQGVIFPIGVFLSNEIEKEVEKKSAEKNIKIIVLGLPVSDDGGENHICNQVQKLGSTLNSRGFKVEYVNERFSTQNVITSTPEERKDDLAAAQILKFWFQKK